MHVILGTCCIHATACYIGVKNIIVLFTIACPRPSDSRVWCLDGGEHYPSWWWASQIVRRGNKRKKRGESDLFFFLVNIFRSRSTIWMPGKDHLYDKRGSAVFTPWYELKSEVNVGKLILSTLKCLEKKLFSDIIHTSSLMLIVLIIWCKNCLVSSRNCRTWRLLSSWWNSWTLKRQIKKLIFMMLANCAVEYNVEYY